MKSLFISDLHLHPDNPDCMQLFEDFIDEHATSADTLFILGDLFEYWLGDDAIAFSGYQRVADSLSRLHDTGTKIYIMHGNRDFLVGQEFTTSSNSNLLPDPSIYLLDETRVLLSHGDYLCTDDHEHQAFRRQTSDAAWQSSILQQSLEARDALAKQIRKGSENGKQLKPEAIMDVNQSSVESQMRQHEVNLLIHGHTHRPDIHSFELDGGPAYRIVLGDWYHTGSYLSYSDGLFELTGYPDNKVQSRLELA